jgi:hypothetical protein
MEDITLNKEEFKLFDQDDQMGFFYDDEGWPKEGAEINFEADVDKLYEEYDFISVDSEDNIYGLKNQQKELIMENVIEAYEIALEVKEL